MYDQRQSIDNFKIMGNENSTDDVNQRTEEKDQHNQQEISENTPADQKKPLIIFDDSQISKSTNKNKSEALKDKELDIVATVFCECCFPGL